MAPCLSVDLDKFETFRTLLYGRLAMEWLRSSTPESDLIRTALHAHTVASSGIAPWTMVNDDAKTAWQ